MKTRVLMIMMGVLIFLTGSALAQMMDGGHMGGHMGGNNNGGQNTGNNTGGGHMGGMGSGMAGAGGMVSGMMGSTVSHGYLNVLNPLDTPSEARAVIQAFLDSSNSGLQIFELWEYDTAYVAELTDTDGAMAFDLVADKSTGVVSPEMGLSMMMNASYGKTLYNMPKFGKSLNIALDQAKANAQSLVNKNNLSYTLGTAEVYPGYYKFHTQDGTDYGMDIMVSGYSGGIWMNTLLGVPLANVTNVQ